MQNVANGLWTFGFFFQFLWIIMQGRSPPEFIINVVELDSLQLIATTLKFIPSLIFTLDGLRQQREHEWDFVDWNWLRVSAGFVFFIGNLISVVSIHLVNRNAAGGYDTKRPFHFNNL